MIEFGTVSTALHPPRRVWREVGRRRAGFVGQEMPDDVKVAAQAQHISF